MGIMAQQGFILITIGPTLEKKVTASSPLSRSQYQSMLSLTVDFKQMNNIYIPVKSLGSEQFYLQQIILSCG